MEKETKDIMHDFGELGKWSEHTLLAHSIFISGSYPSRSEGYVSEIIEAIYEKKFKQYSIKYPERWNFRCTKLKKITHFPEWTQNEFENFILNIIRDSKQAESLTEDYAKYKEVIKEINLKKNKEKRNADK